MAKSSDKMSEGASKRLQKVGQRFVNSAQLVKLQQHVKRA